MKQRLLIGITALLLLTVPVCLMLWGFCLSAQYEDTFLGELKYKCRRLEETEGRRIVLVGGSSVAFGVDSALLEAAFPEYTVVNFGMYAALGTTVMLDLSQDSIRAGDIVLLIPEQQEQTLSDYLDGGLLWQALDGDFVLLGCIRRESWGQLAGQFPSFAAGKLGYALTGRPEPAGVYARSSFDEYGDIISTLCGQNIMAGGYDASTPIRFREDMATEEFLQAVNRYAEELAERGADVWYYFCPMNGLAVEEGADVDGYYDALQADLIFPILGNPNNSVMEATWFYDTNFHLNASGKTVYTRQLIRDIKAMLGDSSPTDIPLPEPPAMAENGLLQGDNSDLDCFTYEMRAGEAFITGLTGAGLEREELILPAVYEGCPVVSVEPEALAGADRLRRVTVQKNITAIGDGAFRGCGQLEALILEAEEPSACRVGQGLLEGTDALIYVNQTALSAYRTDYFWSIYGDRIFAVEES